MQRFGDVTVELEVDHVATVELTRPPDNVLDLELTTSLADAFEHLSAQPACRAIVLAGAGRHFSAGARLNPAAAPGPPAERNPLYDQAVRIFAVEVPVVAAVHGAAIGAGLGLALAADFRVTCPQARLSANFTQLGFHPGFGLTATLPAVVGQQSAAELLYTGRRVTGTEATTMGLCDRLVEQDEVRATARRLAGEIAGCGPLAVRALRRTLRRNLPQVVAEAMLLEHRAQTQLRGTADFAEGVAAYGERRPPRFSGR